ncbi:MAG: LysR family transcriptional regulator [Alphaproteobacteria bacterium]|nr:LysR family transcriptional regulator [Alphaproteobacteria bacterium]
MLRPTLRQLDYLIAIEDEESFKRAAETCNVTQSTLSAGIQELEQILEHPLVNRGQRQRVTLTAFGAEVTSKARDILAETDKLVARAKQLQSPLTGPLRMGVIPTIAPYMLPEILPVLSAAFPALELQLHEDLSDRLVEKCEKGLLDVVLMAFPFETPALTQFFLFEEPFTLAVPKGREPEAREVSTGDLDPGELLLLDDGHCLSDHAIAACGLQKPKHRKAYSATSLQTLIQMVASGYGITLLPEMATRPENLSRNIVTIPFADPKPTRQIGLAWRSGHARRGEFEELGKAIKN